MKYAVIAAVSLMILMVNAAARAEVQFTSGVVYFEVQGKTPAELYKSILARSLRIEGKHTVASITTRLTQSGQERETGQSCKVQDYKIKLNFVVQRPQLPDETVLTPADRENWEQMSAFIRSHEELHRQIWLGCAQALSDRVTALELLSCRDVTQKTNVRWSEMIRDCDLKQRSFDDEQTRLLLKQQFYIHAMSGQPQQ